MGGGKMAYMQTIKYSQDRVQKAFGDGINVGAPPFDISDTELTYCRNISGKNYPAASVRDGRQSVFSAITTPNALGQRDNQYVHVLDGTAWKRWDGSAWQTVQAGLSNVKGKFVDFARGTDYNTILATSLDTYYWQGSVSTSIPSAPKTSLYAAHKGRLYALKGKVLYFCALNIITDWTTADDSGQITITNMLGDGTAICEYSDHILLFSEQSMHELEGSGPDYYVLSNISLSDGCISDRTVKECKGILYFLDNMAVKAFTGSMPSVVSEKVKTYIEGINSAYKSNCCAGVCGDSYFLSIPYGDTTTNNIILELDTRIGKWFVHTSAISDFVTIGDTLYGVDYSGNFYNMKSGTADNGTAISWELITKAFNEGAIGKQKELQEMNITADLPVGSILNVYYSTSKDQNDFVLLDTFTGDGITKNLHSLFPVMSSLDWYKLKFSGTGPCTLHNVEVILRVRPR